MSSKIFGVAQAQANRTFPNKNGPSGLQFLFPFNTNGIVKFDYQLQLQPAKLEWITGVFVNNAANAQQFILTIGETGQKILVPANSQASIELFGLISDKVSISGETTGNVDVQCIFLNYVPQGANSIWSVLDPGTVLGAITVNGQVTTLPLTGAFSPPATIAILAGGASQTTYPALAARRRLMIYNPATSAGQGIGGSPEILYLNFGANAGVDDGSSFEILPGGVYDSGMGPVSTQDIRLAAATTGHRFIARQM